MCLGFVAVFNFHKAAKIPDMYSLHSWVGMATLVMFFLQVHTHTHTLKCCDWNCNIPFHLLLLLPVGDRLAVLPVSVCVIMVTCLVSPHPCVLRTGSAGHVHRGQPAGHHREAHLQPVRPSTRLFHVSPVSFDNGCKCLIYMLAFQHDCTEKRLIIALKVETLRVLKFKPDITASPTLLATLQQLWVTH